MASTRTRFTVSYFAIAMGALLAFSIALWVTRRTVARDQLNAQAQDYAARLLSDIELSQEQGVRLTIADSANPSSIILTEDLRQYLLQKPGYFVLYGANNQPLFNSSLIRTMRTTDAGSLLSYLSRVTSEVGVMVPITSGTDNDQYLFLVARNAGPALQPRISRIVVGLPDTDVQLAGQLLAGTMVVLLPFILLACLGAAYYLAGHAFTPMQDLTNQLEAITDGRSLHRRLPPLSESDELGRLTTTTNAMLSRLEVSFAALRRFTADASHELKTPLAVLRADVERAMHPRTTREDRMVALEESLQEVTRMSDLVDSLLALARADEGRFDLAHEPVNIEPLLRDVFETATILGESADLSIAMPALTDAVVMGERARLRQLLLNLITNAIKYTPKGGAIEISSTMKSATEIAIAVRDTGIGISATDLPHIFDRFWRADKARARVAERTGFGLGLAISQYIAQAHGGSLLVQSRLGRGTLFTVLLPVVAVAESATPDAAVDESAPRVPVSTAARTPDSHADFTDS